MKFHRLLLCLVICSLTTGCWCVRDISLDPDSKFHAIQGRTFALQQSMLVYRESGIFERNRGNAELLIYVAGDGKHEIPAGILPAGTRIRVVNAIGEFCETGLVYVYVNIIDGEYAGKRAEVVSYGVWDEKQWAANPKFLVAIE